MPLCIKGKFYAKAVVVYITTAFYAIEFGVKSPCEKSWSPLQKLLIHKGKTLRQRAKLLELPLMHLIDRAYPIQVMALQIKWRKIFPLCSLQLFQKLLIHKEKNLRQRAKLLHGAAPDVLN